MARALFRLDDLATRSRPLWGWIGQAAVMVLGVHLAADRLDDIVYDSIKWAALPWPDPGTPAFLATWSALVLELAVIAWGVWTLLMAARAPSRDWPDWRAHVSLLTIVRTAFWLPVSLTGAWVVGMSLEDALHPVDPQVATWAAYGIGALVAWRFALTGWWTVTRAARHPGTRIDGWWWAPVPLAVAALSLRYGLPVWGWL